MYAVTYSAPFGDKITINASLVISKFWLPRKEKNDTHI